MSLLTYNLVGVLPDGNAVTTAKTQPIAIVSADGLTLNLSVFDSAGRPLDIGGSQCTITFRKALIFNPPVVTSKTALTMDAPNGLAAFPMAFAETSLLTAGLYTYAITLTDSLLQTSTIVPTSLVTVASPGLSPGQVPDPSSFRYAVAVATGTNVSQSGIGTFDGVLLSDGDRVLCYAQNSAVNNGLWIAKKNAAWIRPVDFFTGQKASGAFTFVQLGSSAGQGWLCTSQPGIDIIGSSNLTWNQFTGASLPVQTTANGLFLRSLGGSIGWAPAESQTDGGAAWNTTPRGTGGSSAIVDVDSEIHIYVQSDIEDADPTVTKPTWGASDQQSDPTAASRPLRSLHGLYQYVKKSVWGRRTIVHLMADAGVGSLSQPDPDLATISRSYVTRELIAGSHEAFRTSFSYRGPRKMLVYSTPTFSSAAGANPINTQLNFTNNLDSNAARAFLRVTAVDGREKFFPMPIRAMSGASLWLDCQLTGADINAASSGATFQICNPAVLILSTGGPGQGVRIVGDGPAVNGDFEFTSTVDPLTKYYSTFERVWPVRPIIQCSGEVSFESCLLDDIPRKYSGTLKLKNCLIIQALLDHGGETQVPAATYQHVLSLEPAGRPLNIAGSSTNDPITRENGCDAVILGSLQLGSNFHGGTRSNFRVHKGLSIAPRGGPSGQDGTGGIVIDNDSMFYVSNNATLYVNAGNVPAMIWCKDGKARLNTTANYNVFVRPDSTPHLGVSRAQTGIDLGTGAGQIDEAAGLNGYYSLRNHVNGAGKLDENTASIFTKVWDQAGSTGYNDGR